MEAFTYSASRGKPVDWNNADIGDALKPYDAQFPTPQPDAWQRVHEFALKQAGGSR